MFWGLVLEPGKRYSTTVEKGFHVSKAALDCSSIRNDNEILSVMLETEGSENLLCNLCKGKGILQETLDLNFMSGDRLTFECRGHGRIHLTGYLLPEDDDISGMLGEEEESEEEEEPEWTATSNTEKTKKEKRKSDVPPDVPAKKKKSFTLDDTKESDSDDDEESDLSDGLEDEEVDDEDNDGEEEDDETDDEDMSDDEDNVNLSLKKKEKEVKNKTPNKQNLATPKKTPVTNGVTPKEQKSNKKTPGGDKNLHNQSPKQRQVLDQGVVVREIKIGSGQPAKIGKTVSVHYIGKVKETGKVFDKQTKGEGFKFKLGKGEVIKGWDIGLQNMKVGGKRVIHCPPDVAYGAKGAPPKIPSNSTLIFEVELKNVY